jgi:hypothetical protein
MWEYDIIYSFLTEKNLYFFTFYTKADGPAKTIIRHQPRNISAESITVAPTTRDTVMSSVLKSDR